jgi:transposase-like protein
MQERNGSMVALPASESRDVLSDVLRQGAQRMLAQAIDVEVTEWIEAHAAVRDEHGRRQVVRNGHLPTRSLVTGVGPVEVRQPRVHDRRSGDHGDRFHSKILPPYLRKAKSIEELIPWLYLKGISTGDFGEALAALVGPECPWNAPQILIRVV